MTTNTYVALDKATVSGTSTTTVTFTVPSGYTDLFIVTSARNSTSGGTDYFMRFNSDTASNYSYVQMIGNGSTAASDKAGSASQFNIGYVAGTSGTAPTICRINIQNYLNTTTNKTILYNWNSQGADAKYVLQGVGLWRKAPEAITSISIYTTTGNIVAGSTFSLYGISSADNFAKATGGMLFEDSTYWYHVFGATGTFTPKQSLTCDYLVVAGGGGGGGSIGGGYLGGGGGGAGGYRTSIGGSALSLSATAYTVTVGAGGAGGNATKGSNGADSVFSTITSTGGGYGGAQDSGFAAGGNGGSGGGGSTYIGTVAGGTGTSGQGFAGGSSKAQAGGGGGASAVGGNGDNSVIPVVKGIGGAGSNSALAWATVTGTGVGGYYAGGGGGGAYGGVGGVGGAGGGANGGDNLTAGIAAIANTGGGGGGSGGSGGSNLTGGNGGSGIVIVRYAK